MTAVPQGLLDAATRFPGKAYRRNSCLLVLIIAALILFIRKTDSFINPQFWAEDGAVYFIQQYGGGASVLFREYAGYLQFICRLIAFFTNMFFPFSVAPIVYVYSSLVLTLLVIANVFSPRFKADYKPLLALSIVMVPHFTNEIFMNLSNTQWILSILLFITLLKENPGREYGNLWLQACMDLVILLLCGLTGPFCILLLPLAFWKYKKDRSSFKAGVFMVMLLTSCIQIFYILKYAPLAESKYSLNPAAYIVVIGWKFFGNLFLGHFISYKLNPYFLFAVGTCIIVTIIQFSSASKTGIKMATVCIGYGVVVLAAILYKCKVDPLILVPAGNGPRYFYIPCVMITWSLILCMKQEVKWKRTLTKSLLILILISSLSSGFHSKPLNDYAWASYSKLIGSKNDLTIPINPKGWYIKIPSR